jgi:hypothetical protein
MRDWQQVSVAADIDIYFCGPHAPWQRGLLRRYLSIPRRTAGLSRVPRVPVSGAYLVSPVLPMYPPSAYGRDTWSSAFAAGGGHLRVAAQKHTAGAMAHLAGSAGRLRRSDGAAGARHQRPPNTGARNDRRGRSDWRSKRRGAALSCTAHGLRDRAQAQACAGPRDQRSCGAKRAGVPIDLPGETPGSTPPSFAADLIRRRGGCAAFAPNVGGFAARPRVSRADLI